MHHNYMINHSAKKNCFKENIIDMSLIHKIYLLNKKNLKEESIYEIKIHHGK